MKKIIILKSEYFGDGSDELGQKLMGSFLRKLWADPKKPDAIILYNSAVKLIAENSDVLDAFDGLYSNGIDLIACGTCIGYYNLKNRMHVGRVSDMREIVSILMNAESVITI